MKRLKKIVEFIIKTNQQRKENQKKERNKEIKVRKNLRKETMNKRMKGGMTRRK